MLPGQRRERVLREVRATGAVRVTDIAGQLGVSDMTIRRDLEELDNRRLIRRVHGGATAISPGTSDEPGFLAKSSLETAAKHAIAREAAGLVEPGMTIAISAGTTTHAFAQAIATIPDLTIVTNATDAANLLFDAVPASSQVVLTGGVRTPSHALVGPMAISALRDLHVDMVFHGFHGFAVDAGFTCPNLAEVATAQAMIECGHQLVVLVDHTKAGVVALAKVAELDRASILVTDDQIDPDLVERLRQRVGTVLLATLGLCASALDSERSPADHPQEGP